MSNMLKNKTHAQWMAEDDARTLASADEIKADAKRLAAATKAAGPMGEEQHAAARRMDKVARVRASLPKTKAKKKKA